MEESNRIQYNIMKISEHTWLLDFQQIKITHKSLGWFPSYTGWMLNFLKHLFYITPMVKCLRRTQATAKLMNGRMSNNGNLQVSMINLCLGQNQIANISPNLTNWKPNWSNTPTAINQPFPESQIKTIKHKFEQTADQSTVLEQDPDHQPGSVENPNRTEHPIRWILKLQSQTHHQRKIQIFKGIIWSKHKSLITFWPQKN